METKHTLNINPNLTDESRRSQSIDNIYYGVYIPFRFTREILKHLILNYSKIEGGFSPPLFFAVQGAKGEGKSFMIETLCKHYSIKYIPLSGAELCGSLEGDSNRKLMKVYNDACTCSYFDKSFSCIVIEDFHKSIAASNKNNTNRTTNSDTLVGQMMNMADHPYVNGVRTPIILTGNNFEVIYSPLTRNGRMGIL